MWNSKDDSQGVAWLEREVQTLLHMVPRQEPLFRFVHHNPLGALLDQGFYRAMNSYASWYGAKQYLGLDEYRKLYAEGQITSEILLVFARSVPELAKLGEQTLIDFLLHVNFVDPGVNPEFLVRRSLGLNPAVAWVDQLMEGSDVSEALAPDISYVRSRQSVHTWEQVIGFPIVSQASIYWQRSLALLVDRADTMGDLQIVPTEFWKLLNEAMPTRPKDKSWMADTTDSLNAIATGLMRVCDDQHSARMLLSYLVAYHRGWFALLKAKSNECSIEYVDDSEALYGLVHVMVRMFAGLSAGTSKFRVIASVDDETRCAAASLRFQAYDLISNKKFHCARDRFEDVVIALRTIDRDLICAIFHRALEESTHQRLVAKLNLNTERSKQGIAWAAVLFCLDDRECSSRRHLESLCSGIHTYGVPGFFALPIAVNTEHGNYQSCPPMLKPTASVKEHRPERTSQSRFGLLTLKLMMQASHSPVDGIQGGIRSLWAGLLALPLLSVMTFVPWLIVILRRLILHPPKSTLTVLIDDDQTEAEEAFGDSLPALMNPKAAAGHIHRLLGTIGLADDIPEIVACVGHGASSLNNPFFAAYDCAACSGQSGEVNARSFALLANDPRVRAELQLLGVNIADKIVFVAIQHDTTTDDFSMVEVPDHLSASAEEKLAELSRILDLTGGKNALERCRRFERAKKLKTAKQALQEVADRGHALFEPRPELGHTGCSLILVGERSLSRGIDLERRAFLVSYAPSRDPDGMHLRAVLRAVLPICCGISYDYYCSRVDHTNFGSGSKLAHNIMAMIGVSNGAEDTLLTGLPSQMVELHEPIRPLLLVQATIDLIQRIVCDDDLISQYVAGEWIKLGCVDPKTQRLIRLSSDLRVVS